MADPTTRFFAWSGTVARMVTTEDFGSTIAVYNRHQADWVDAPGLLGALTGLGGDPAADVISRADAELSLSAPPPEPELLRLDGPGFDVSYRDVDPISGPTERAALEARLDAASGMTDDQLLALGCDLAAWRDRHPADVQMQGEELALLLSPEARAALGGPGCGPESSSGPE